jgi:hypothetical protein
MKLNMSKINLFFELTLVFIVGLAFGVMFLIYTLGVAKREYMR